MPNEMTRVPISRSYVRRSMLLILVVGATPPLTVLFFMARFGFDPDLAYLVAASVIAIMFLLWVMAKIYCRALTQNIQLNPNSIIFDYITYKQEFKFNSAIEWKLEKAGKNWRLTSLKDGSSKLVPISAFPKLQNETQRYYCGTA